LLKIITDWRQVCKAEREETLRDRVISAVSLPAQTIDHPGFLQRFLKEKTRILNATIRMVNKASRTL
jgi:hypothetical protein